MKDHIASIIETLRSKGWQSETIILESEFQKLESTVASANPSAERTK